MFRREDAGKKVDEVLAKISADVSAVSTRIEEVRNEVIAEVKANSLDVKKSVEGLASLLSRISKDLVEGTTQLNRVIAQLNASSEKLAELSAVAGRLSASAKAVADATNQFISVAEKLDAVAGKVEGLAEHSTS